MELRIAIKNDGLGNFDNPEIAAEGFAAETVDIGDIDNDGYIDIIAAYYNGGNDYKVAWYKK